jgi:hypothetical protein
MSKSGLDSKFTLQAWQKILEGWSTFWNCQRVLIRLY